jgi:hypothetical protein
VQTDLTPVLALFCGAPLVLFWVGFFFGRWSARVRIVRVDQGGVTVNDTRYTRAGASAPTTAPVKRIMTATPHAGEPER